MVDVCSSPFRCVPVCRTVSTSPLRFVLRSNLLDDIGSDWREEDLRERVSIAAGSAICGEDRDGRSGGHLDRLMGFCRGVEIAGRREFAIVIVKFAL